MPATTSMAPTTTAPTARTNRAIDLAGRLVIAPALLIAPFVAIDRAAAACDPKSPVNNATVTCTGTTTNQNGTNGYGSNTDTGNTITVQPGASVIGATDGLLFVTGTVKNSGTITGGTNGIGVHADDATVTNSGTISAGRIGIDTVHATVTNFGTISTGPSGLVGISAGTANVINFGNVMAGPNGSGIAANVATVTNSGTITGGIGIRVDNGDSTITNSGTIIGLTGTAIRLSSKVDTLNLLPGSRIVGAINMGGGNDVVNFTSGGGVAQLVTLQNFTGTINTFGVGPIVHSATQIATLDATAFGQTDRTLLDFTGGVSSLVQSRLGGAPPNGSIQGVSYAPDGANRLIGKAPAAGYAAPTVVWTGGFGGTRTQDATGETFRASSTVWGGVLGVDQKVRGDLLLGAFIGGGTGRLTVNKSSESVNTDYVGGGVYGRFDSQSNFMDFTVQGGSAESRSSRLVLSNLAPNGQETATARYSGWFVSPELTYGMRYALGNGNTLTPFARVRYLAGIFDGYSEQGSGQNLSIGGRTLQNLEERGELELSRTASFGNDTMRTSLHGGVIALQRLGDTSINGMLVGQSFSFATPGQDSTVGAVFGGGFDVTINKRVSLFGAAEGTVMSDKSRTATAKAGMRVGF